VRPTPWTWSAVVVAVVLGIIGLFLDAPAAASASVGLGALLSGEAALFLFRTVHFVDSLSVERMVEQGTVYLGGPVEVGVHVTSVAVPGITIRIQDLPPHSAVYNPEETILQDGEGRYRIRLMVPGEVSFCGILVEISDRFFATTLCCTTPRFSGTMLTVYPAAGDRPDKGLGSGTGEFELERHGVLRGQGIRAFRPFKSGDDRAMMDWKLSAKYNRLFVREPTSQFGDSPLLIVDLPVVGAEDGEALLAAAGGAIGQVVRDNGFCNLLVIAGGEVIEFLYHEQSIPALVRNLRFRSVDFAIPYFRVYDPIVLRKRLRVAERGVSDSSRRLSVVLRSTLSSLQTSAFEKEVRRILTRIEHPSVIVYSTASGEISHLNLIAGAARCYGCTLMILLLHPHPGVLAQLSPYARVEFL